MAGPISLTGCGTIDQPGSYILEQPVFVNPWQTCFVIQADFVTLDLGGNLVWGTTNSTGVDVRSARGTTVRNGAFKGFDTGITATYAAGTTIERVVFKENTTGARVSNTVIRDSHVVDNTSYGLALGGGSLVTGTTFSGNMFGIIGGDGSTISGNVLSQNSYGIYMVGSYPAGGSTVVNNTVNGNSGTGVVVSCPSNVMGNTIVNNNWNQGNLALQGDGCNSTNNVAP